MSLATMVVGNITIHPDSCQDKASSCKKQHALGERKPKSCVSASLKGIYVIALGIVQ